jgi:PAS domain S-box-containing protein
MGWLAFGVLYAIGYAAVGWFLQDAPLALRWFRLPALLVMPLLGVLVIVRRRHVWSGCQWLFWATVALGLMMSAIGLVGWTADELLEGYETSWLGWHIVFALFGAVAPLFALLAQPHRGRREAAAPSTAVDIAGLAVVTGFLYSYFVMVEDASARRAAVSFSLVMLSELQQLLVAMGIAAAAMVARGSSWGATYRRLALGSLVHFAALTVSTLEIWQGGYRAGFVYDFVWIVPFAFYPWAARAAPASADDTETSDVSFTPSRPWIIFGALALLPLADSALRRAFPLGPLDPFRNVSMAVTVVSALPLLMARLAVERAQTRQADAELRLLAAAIEQAEELIWIVTRDGRFRHTNNALRRGLGYAAADLERMTLSELVAEESSAQAAAIDEAVRGGHIWHGTVVRLRNDGSTFSSSATVVPLSDERGSMTHVLGVERDISEELRLREQLIHTERLSAVGQLVSGVAHELNNPLQSILGFTELLLEAEQRQGTRRDLDRVRSEAERAGKIVGNLLAFVRRSSSERVLADLNELVQTAVALHAYELKMENIEVEEHYARGLRPVVVNREEIQQIVLNLILNAEHAMRTAHGGGRLVVRTEADASRVAVDISDTGTGVSGHLAGRIFEPFFTTKGVGEGTGLGLSIALGIAQAHSGSLELVPSEQGAHFRLTLPASDEAAVASRRVPDIEPAAAPAGRRALVAEDEASVRELLRRLLAKRGFSVDLADDGRAAAALLRRRRYDLVICGMRMPRMGGLMLYELVRAEYPNLLRGFAFVTGDTVNQEARRILEPMQVPVLTKPFTSSDLDALLRQLESLCPAS